MQKGKKCTELSKLVSHALRHEPWLYELELDEEGWTSVETLLISLRNYSSEWQYLQEEDLLNMINHSDKRRHEIHDGKIRALYGHSLPGKLKKQVAIPPELLFHGTAPQLKEVILKEGLKPMIRQYVHLSCDMETAIRVGKRKSANPIILRVMALEACQNNLSFYAGNERVWLADYVPPKFIIAD